MIHRDMKSPNILLTREGMAKIADVGMMHMQASPACHAGASGPGASIMCSNVWHLGTCTAANISVLEHTALCSWMCPYT